MNRDDVLAILGTLTLAGMAYLDAGWRWFWITTAVVMAAWAIGGAISREQ